MPDIDVAVSGCDVSMSLSRTSSRGILDESLWSSSNAVTDGAAVVFSLSLPTSVAWFSFTLRCFSAGSCSRSILSENNLSPGER